MDSLRLSQSPDLIYTNFLDGYSVSIFALMHLVMVNEILKQHIYSIAYFKKTDVINSYKPGVLFMGHRQTVKPQM